MARTLTHVVSFRVTAEEHSRLAQLRTTFPEEQWGEVFRWLLQQEPVVQTVSERIIADQPSSARWVSGAEAALPVGDR